MTVIDEGGIEALAVYHTRETHELSEPTILTGLDIGRPIEMEVSPTHDHVALTNHRNEIFCSSILPRRPSR